MIEDKTITPPPVGPPAPQAEMDGWLSRVSAYLGKKYDPMGDVTGEASFGLPSGRNATLDAVNKATSASKLDEWINAPRRLLGGVPGIGKPITLDDLYAVAAKNPDFATAFDPIRKAKEESDRVAKEMYGDNPNWQEIQAPLLDKKIAGKNDGPIGAILQRAQYELDHGKPGVTRPPISDNELLQAGIAILDKGGKDIIDASVPGAASAMIRGLVAAAKTTAVVAPTGALLRGLGTMAPFEVAFGEGTALSVADQVLQKATGQRKDLSLEEAVKQGALMSAGQPIGEAAATMFPRKEIARTVGQLGTVLAGNEMLAPDQPNAQPSDHPLADRLNKVIETATMLVAAHRMNALGDPDVRLLNDIANSKKISQAEAADNLANTQVTWDALSDNARSIANWATRGRLGGPRDTANPDINRINAEMIPIVVATRASHGRYISWLKEASGTDDLNSPRLREVDLAVRRIIENGGKQPESGILPSGRQAVPFVDPQLPDGVLAEGLKRLKTFGAQNLEYGKIAAREIGFPEGIYKYAEPVDQSMADTRTPTKFERDQRLQTAADALYDDFIDLPKRFGRQGKGTARYALAGDENIGDMARLHKLDAEQQRALYDYANGLRRMQVNFDARVNAIKERYKNNPDRMAEMLTRTPDPFQKRPARKDVGHEGWPNGLRITQEEFDAGRTYDSVGSDGRVIPGRPVSRQAAKDGEYGELVGGLNKFLQDGHWLPQIGMSDELPTDKPLAGSGSRVDVKAPFDNSDSRRFFNARKESFEEAIANPARLLDLHPNRNLDVSIAESEMLKRNMLMSGYRERNMILDSQEMAGRQQSTKAGEDASSLQSEINDLHKQFAAKPTTELRDEILSKRQALSELKAASNGTLFRRIPNDKKWGPWAGMWMHRTAFGRMNASMMTPEGFSAAWKELHGIVKEAKIGMNPAQIPQQTWGNYRVWKTNGVDQIEHLPETVSALSEMRDSLKGKGEASPELNEFLAWAQGHNLSGASNLSGSEESSTDRLPGKIARLEAQGKSAGPLKAVLRGKQAVNFLLGPFVSDGMETQGIPQVGKAFAAIPRTVKWIDLSSNYASFKIMRRYGIDGSGPMTSAEAFDHIVRVSDNNTLPDAVNTAANVFSTIRFPAKVVQGLSDVMQRRPSIFGENITTPFDPFIVDRPGSGGAQAAVVARGVTNFMFRAAEVMAPLAGIAAVSREDHGISDKKMDAFVEGDAAYSKLPDAVKWAIKKTFFVTEVTPLGRIKGINTLGWDPHVQAWTWFHSLVAPFGQAAKTSVTDGPLSHASGLDWREAFWQAGQKSMLLGPIAQMAAGEDYRGKAVEEGIGPRERFSPAWAGFMPAIPMDAINGYMNEQNVPPQERDALWATLKALSAGTMKAMAPPPQYDLILKKINEFVRDGTLIKNKNEEGHEWWSVSDGQKLPGGKMTPKGLMAQEFLKMSSDIPISYYGEMIRMWRQQQELKQKMGNATK